MAAEDSKEKLMGNLATVLELGPRRAQSAQTGGTQPLRAPEHRGVLRRVIGKRWLEKPFRLEWRCFWKL